MKMKMGSSSSDKEENNKFPLLNHSPKPKLGGIRTIPFIIVNESFERVASIGLSPNMVFYLMNDYNMELATTSIIISLWSALSNGLAIVGAMLADSCLGRFRVIALGSISSLLGMTTLWLTAMIPQLKPVPCDQLNNSCNSPSIENFGWRVGFAVPALLMAFSTLIFLLGSVFYIKVRASKSLFSGFAQVLVVAFKNRNIDLPPSPCDDCYYQGDKSKLLAPTNNLRCLNKACIITNSERDLNPDGSASDPWSLCTVEQVESLKTLLKAIPMWSTGIMVTVSMTQNSFATLQAKTMDRHLISKFEIPAGSFSIFMIVTLIIWIGLYEWAIVPLLTRYTGNSRGITPKVRIGISLVVTSIAMAIGAITESVRRKMAVEDGVADDPNAIVDMSAMWLIPQFVLLGVGDAFNSTGQIEFYMTRFSKSMSSIAVALYTVGIAMAALVGSVLVSTVDDVTSSGGQLFLMRAINDEEEEESHEKYVWKIVFPASTFVFGNYQSVKPNASFAKTQPPNFEIVDPTWAGSGQIYTPTPGEVLLFYKITGYNNFALQNNVDMHNMVCLARAFHLQLVDIIIEQHRGKGKGRRVDGPSNPRANSDDVVLRRSAVDIDDDVDLLPTFCSNNDKAFLSASWATGSIYIGQ
ncbi:hypothetical protein TEA_021673 [Camellia sinensis var. sinensis]|uniref:Uncharacterized protein n=1 Tax=Camellia sinensis var. sinensis TaxID=542762 RepID=A0A4S4E2M2_CAMSN|nr:hypothetical protein TEA_021673 [Camellia sinensis var. sinensis]